MPEVRTMPEGSLWWVQASGSGLTWTTASTPASGLWGFVKSFTYSSGLQVNTISDRGVPVMHKLQSKQPIEGTIEFMWTGRSPLPGSGSGASMPMIHLEHRASAVEVGNGTTGDYTQFIGVVLMNQRFTEADDGNKLSVDFRALAMNGPTGSGYIK